MPERRYFRRRKLRLSGDVFFVQVSMATSEGVVNRELWGYVNDMRDELRAEVSLALNETLGPEFTIRTIAFGEGSLELIVVVGAAYVAISRYKSFVESIELFTSQVEAIANAIFRRSASVHPPISSSWTPGPAILHQGLDEAEPRDYLRTGLLSWYLMLTNAAMLAVLVWLLVQALG